MTVVEIDHLLGPRTLVLVLSLSSWNAPSYEKTIAVFGASRCAILHEIGRAHV